MAFTVNINGVNYTLPNYGDSNINGTSWGILVDQFFIGVAEGMVPMNGGTFPLTGPLSFGSNYGISAVSGTFTETATNALLILEGSNPGATAGNGTFWTNSSDHNLYFTSSQGVTSQLTPPDLNAGTVTYVGLSLPGVFTVTNSPVTNSGTLTATFGTQSQNQVLASPDGISGSLGVRSLVANDIPNLSAGKITTGQLNTAQLPSNIPLANLAQTGATSGQVIAYNGSLWAPANQTGGGGGGWSGGNLAAANISGTGLLLSGNAIMSGTGSNTGLTVSGTATVTGTTSLQGLLATTAAFSGNETVQGNVIINGTESNNGLTVSGNATVTNAITANSTGGGVTAPGFTLNKADGALRIGTSTNGLAIGATNCNVGSTNGTALIFTNNLSALLFDTSQNATFNANVNLPSGTLTVTHSGQFGSLGVGGNLTTIGMETVSGLALMNTTRQPVARAGEGILWANSADSNLYYLPGSGGQYQLTPPTGGGGGGGGSGLTGSTGQIPVFNGSTTAQGANTLTFTNSQLTVSGELVLQQQNTTPAPVSGAGMLTVSGVNGYPYFTNSNGQVNGFVGLQPFQMGVLGSTAQVSWSGTGSTTTFVTPATIGGNTVNRLVVTGITARKISGSPGSSATFSMSLNGGFGTIFSSRGLPPAGGGNDLSWYATSYSELGSSTYSTMDPTTHTTLTFTSAGTWGGTGVFVFDIQGYYF